MWGGLAAAPARFQWAQLSMAQNDFKAAISHASSCVDILLPGTKKAAARGSQGAGEAEEEEGLARYSQQTPMRFGECAK